MKISDTFKNIKYKVFKLADLLGILKYVNITTSKKIYNITVKIPVIQAHGYQQLIGFEAWAFEIYKKILSVLPGAFIDVGVNNGQTLLKIMAIDKERDYAGFEPNPVCYTYVRQLIQANKFVNCNLFPVGLNDENTILDLYHDTEFASGASVLSKFRNNMSRYKTIQHVALLKGDEVLLKKPLERIAFIKADVEGTELEVIKGLTQTIKKHEPVILLEILPVYSSDSSNGQYRKSRQDELLEIMKSLNYSMFLINETHISLTELNDIAVHGDMNQTNYLFIPAAKKKSITELFL